MQGQPPSFTTNAQRIEALNVGINELQGRLKLDADNSLLWKQISRLYFRRWELSMKAEDLEPTQRAFQKALEYPENQNDPSFFFNAARLYVAYGAFEGALSVYRHISNTFPSYPKLAVVHLEIGACLRRIGRLDTALNAFLYCIREEPHDPYTPGDMIVQLAWTYEIDGIRRNNARRIRDAEEAWADAYHQLHKDQSMQGSLMFSSKGALQGWKTWRFSHVKWLHRGQMHYRSGNAALAADCFMEAKRLKEKRLSTDLPNVNAPISLGPEVCLSHGEYSAWNDARDQGPENREPWKGAKAKPYLAMHSRPGRYERYENLMRASRGSGQGALPMPEDEGFEQARQHGRWEPHEREEEGEEKSESGFNDGSLRTLPKKPPQQEESGALSEEEEAEDGIQVIEDVERQAQDLEPEADEVSETEGSMWLLAAENSFMLGNQTTAKSMLEYALPAASLNTIQESKVVANMRASTPNKAVKEVENQVQKRAMMKISFRLVMWFIRVRRKIRKRIAANLILRAYRYRYKPAIHRHARVTIQNLVRQYLARVLYTKSRRSIVRLQCWWRTRLAVEFARDIVRARARWALHLLQRNLRMLVKRSQFVALKQATLLIQRCWRHLQRRVMIWMWANYLAYAKYELEGWSAVRAGVLLVPRRVARQQENTDSIVVPASPPGKKTTSFHMLLRAFRPRGPPLARPTTWSAARCRAEERVWSRAQDMAASMAFADVTAQQGYIWGYNDHIYLLEVEEWGGMVTLARGLYRLSRLGEMRRGQHQDSFTEEEFIEMLGEVDEQLSSRGRMWHDGVHDVPSTSIAGSSIDLSSQAMPQWNRGFRRVWSAFMTGRGTIFNGSRLKLYKYRLPFAWEDVKPRTPEAKAQTAKHMGEPTPDSAEGGGRPTSRHTETIASVEEAGSSIQQQSSVASIPASLSGGPLSRSLTLSTYLNEVDALLGRNAKSHSEPPSTMLGRFRQSSARKLSHEDAMSEDEDPSLPSQQASVQWPPNAVVEFYASTVPLLEAAWRTVWRPKPQPLLAHIRLGASIWRPLGYRPASVPSMSSSSGDISITDPALWSGSAAKTINVGRFPKKPLVRIGYTRCPLEYSGRWKCDSPRSSSEVERRLWDIGNFIVIPEMGIPYGSLPFVRLLSRWLQCLIPEVTKWSKESKTWRRMLYRHLFAVYRFTTEAFLNHKRIEASRRRILHHVRRRNAPAPRHDIEPNLSNRDNGMEGDKALAAAVLSRVLKAPAEKLVKIGASKALPAQDLPAITRAMVELPLTEASMAYLDDGPIVKVYGDGILPSSNPQPYTRPGHLVDATQSPVRQPGHAASIAAPLPNHKAAPEDLGRRTMTAAVASTDILGNAREANLMRELQSSPAGPLGGDSGLLDRSLRSSGFMSAMFTRESKMHGESRGNRTMHTVSHVLPHTTTMSQDLGPSLSLRTVAANPSVLQRAERAKIGVAGWLRWQRQKQPEELNTRWSQFEGKRLSTMSFSLFPSPSEEFTENYPWSPKPERSGAQSPQSIALLPHPPEKPEMDDIALRPATAEPFNAGLPQRLGGTLRQRLGLPGSSQVSTEFLAKEYILCGPDGGTGVNPIGMGVEPGPWASEAILSILQTSDDSDWDFVAVVEALRASLRYFTRLEHEEIQALSRRADSIQQAKARIEEEKAALRQFQESQLQEIQHLPAYRLVHAIKSQDAHEIIRVFKVLINQDCNKGHWTYAWRLIELCLALDPITTCPEHLEDLFEFALGIASNRVQEEGGFDPFRPSASVYPIYARVPANNRSVEDRIVALSSMSVPHRQPKIARSSSTLAPLKVSSLIKSGIRSLSSEIEPRKRIAKKGQMRASSRKKSKDRLSSKLSENSHMRSAGGLVTGTGNWFASGIPSTRWHHFDGLSGYEAVRDALDPFRQLSMEYGSPEIGVSTYVVTMVNRAIQEGVHLSPEAYSNAFRCCTVPGAWRDALSLYVTVQKLKIPIHSTVNSCILEVCANTSREDRKVLAESLKKLDAPYSLIYAASL